MKLSLKAKLGLMFLLFISIPMLTAGFLSYSMAAKALQSTIEQQLRDNTASSAESIDVTLEHIKNYLKVASHNEDLAKVILESDDTLKLKGYNYITTMKKENDSMIDNMIITDSKGKAVMTNEASTSTLDLSDREYFKKAITGAEAISEVVISKISNKPVVAIAYPLKSEGKVVGTLVGTVTFSTISKHVSQVKIGNNGYSFIIDKDSLILYHPNSEKVLKEKLDATDNSDLKVIVEQMKQGKVSEGFYTYEGIRKYMRFQPAGNWIVATTAEYREYMSAAIEIRNDTIIIVVAFIIIALIAAQLMTSRSIINPIKKLEKVMLAAGNGDLTVNISMSSGDEIQMLCDSFNSMISSQENVVKMIRKGSEELTQSAEEMASSAEEISASAEEISNNIQEVAADAEKQNGSVINASQVLVQLSSLVQLAQSKAASTSIKANITMEAALIGREKVRATVDAMNVINNKTEETEEILKIVNELSAKVSEIINTINAIAEQTNLLALNAAIEAARAGEHGRGFTVVAEEVRSLSDQSNIGAKDIAELVKDMVANIEKAVISMSGASEAVKNGVKVVKETDESFIHIRDAVEGITSNVKEIVNITEDEVATSDQIIRLIDSMGTIVEATTANSENVSSATQEQTASVENLAATAQEVSAMSNNLEILVEKFIIRGE